MQAPGPRTASCLWLATAAAHCVQTGRVGAENHADFKYEDYQEANGRIGVQTYAFLLEHSPLAQLTLRANYVHDAVSGASPTGAPPPPGSSQVPLKYMEDARNAGFLEGAIRYGKFTTTPQFSYSLEHDYQSIGGALTQSIDLNQKNTVISLGYSHNADTIMPEFWGPRTESKAGDDVYLGLTQLLSPKAYLTVALTGGSARGYLSDPYKGVRFDGYPDPDSLFPENRPDHRAKGTAFASVAYYIDKVRAGAEVGYRFYMDSFGVSSHTVSAAWNQNIGKYVVISPIFRFYTQSQADFYATRFPGDPSDPDSPIKTPEYYSADYRLSSLSSYTFGLNATVRIKDRLSVDFAYKRYEMYGNDGVTSASAYPKANVFTAGLRLWF